MQCDKIIKIQKRDVKRESFFPSSILKSQISEKKEKIYLFRESSKDTCSFVVRVRQSVERRQITPRIFSISSRRRSPLGELTGGTGEGRSVGARGSDCTGEKPCSRSNRKIQERIHQEVPSFF